MPSVIALRVLLGAGLGLGALDLVWINASLAPRLVASEPAPASEAVPETAIEAPDNAPAAAIETAGTDTPTIEAPEAPAAAPSVSHAPPGPDADEVANEPLTDAVELRRVYFDTGSATLRSTARKALARLAAAAGPNATFVLEGHADYRGDERLNQSLSADRAREVQRHLIQLGIDPGRIRVGYAGEGNETHELWRDRRVDIEITGGTR